MERLVIVMHAPCHGFQEIFPHPVGYTDDKGLDIKRLNSRSKLGNKFPDYPYRCGVKITRGYNGELA